jgi:hypothetical protein
MTLNGTKSGNLSQTVSCAGIATQQTLGFTGSAGPAFGITAPAALAGVVLNNEADTLTVVDPSTLLAAAQTVAVFWYVGQDLHAVYDVVISAIASPGAAETVTLSMTGAKWLVSGDAALPADATAVAIAVSQNITDGVSLVGANLLQTLATSSQPGLVEWLDATPAAQRLSVIPLANGFDAWPTGANQAQPWTDTVVTLRCYNASSASSAVMQVGAVLA